MAGLGGRGMRRSIPVFGGLKSSAERTPSESSGLRLIGVHVKMHIFGVPTLVRQIPSQMPPSLVQPAVQIKYPCCLKLVSSAVLPKNWRHGALSDHHWCRLVHADLCVCAQEALPAPISSPAYRSLRSADCL